MELKLTEQERRSIMDSMMEQVSEIVFAEVRNALDYHGDYFRMAWARCMEAEAHDLEHSTLDGACNHGQKMYRALFNVIEQYHNREGEVDYREGEVDYDE